MLILEILIQELREFYQLKRVKPRSKVFATEYVVLPKCLKKRQLFVVIVKFKKFATSSLFFLR